MNNCITLTLCDGRPQNYVTTKEYARSIGVPQETIRVWIYRKKLDAIKLGNEWFIRIGTPRPSEKPRGRKKKAIKE